MMRNYREKYLKYKKKYLQLKQFKGGRHNEKDSFEILDEMAEEKIVNKYSVSFDINHYTKLQQFFSTIRDNKDYAFIPPGLINTVNYVGKQIVETSDIQKYWSSLNESPLNGNTVEFTPNLFKIRTKSHRVITFNTSITYDHSKQTIDNNIKVNINGVEYELFIINKNNLYDNIITIYKNIQVNIPDAAQYSAITLEGASKIYFNRDDDLREIETRLDNMFDATNKEKVVLYDTTDEKEKPKKSYNIFYQQTNVLVNLGYNVNDDNYASIIKLDKINDNIYNILPINYKNIIINDYYYESIKYLFTVITTKLNEVKPFNNYNNLPDGFFHIHVVPVHNELSKIMLILHAKYEITNASNFEIIYKYKDGAKSYNITRGRNPQNLDSAAFNEARKNHSFYFLIDLVSNDHKLYSMNDSSFNYTDSQGESIWDGIKSIALKDHSFGPVIGDLNYIENKAVILGLQSKSKCNIFCDN